MSATTAELQRTFSGSIPTFYDTCLGAAWFGKFAADLARRLPVDPGGDVLEIACGTGLATRHLRERLDPRRTLVATDLSEAMLDYARGKLPDLRGIDWRQADATKVPVAGGEFAAVVCSFGVMYARDRAALFSEMRRVLQPRGHFIFNVWDRVENNPCIRIYSEVIEGMFPGDEEVQFRVPYDMYEEDLLRELLRGAGFEARRIEKVRYVVEGVSARDIATGQVRGSPRGLLLAKRGAEFEAAIEKVAVALEDAGGQGASFRSHCQAVAVEARAN